MSKQQGYRHYSTEQLVAIYRQAALEHSHSDGAAGNAAADRIAAVYRELRSRGLEHQKRLLPLLLREDDGVRVWAAAHALEFEPRQGEAILSEIAKGMGMKAFSAKMALKSWREGNLHFP
jgi:hypothetical protein